MISLVKKQNGMNIVGQGGKIILFALPSLVAALWIHAKSPDFAALPAGIGFIRHAGFVLLPLGLVLWGIAVVQLVMGFSRGRLVTSGAYAIVRNPIYSSAAFFILPAVSLLTLTWVYFVPAAFLIVGVTIFIGREERQLTETFGNEYESYKTLVDRLVPFKKP